MCFRTCCIPNAIAVRMMVPTFPGSRTFSKIKPPADQSGEDVHIGEKEQDEDWDWDCDWDCDCGLFRNGGKKNHAGLLLKCFHIDRATRRISDKGILRERKANPQRKAKAYQKVYKSHNTNTKDCPKQQFVRDIEVCPIQP